MDTTPPLTGKLAIVTGASRGIGPAVALLLARKGVSAFLLSYTMPSSLSSIESVREKILGINPAANVLINRADMGSLVGPASIVDACLSHFGKRNPDDTVSLRIDIIINNAGVSSNQYLCDVSLEAFDYQYRVNVRGPLFLVQAAQQYLPQDRSGRIVNLSSISSTMGLEAQSVYGGTKAALDAMTRTWARELAERATVNSVNPGPVKTDMYSGTTDFFREKLKPMLQSTPLAQAPGSEKWGGREATPEEVAGVITMLCLPEAAWCTGSVVCANGGMIFGLA